jgi:hypothetical protein
VGSIPVFIPVDIPFFLAAFYCPDWQPKIQMRFIGASFAIDAAMLVIFAGIIEWV